MLSPAPSISPDVRIDAPIDGFRIVHHQATGKYFRLGTREAGFLEGLDGKSSVELLKQDSEAGFSAEQVDRLIAWFSGHDLLAAPAGAPLAPAPSQGLLARLASPERWRIKLVDPNLFLDRHRAAVDALFGRAALGCYLLTALTPAMLFIASPRLALDAFAAFTPMLSMPGWIALYAMIVSTITLHELAHAITCKHFGGRVGQIGLMLLYLHPVPYCDVSDSWRFRDKGSKIAVSAAGIFLQLLLTAVALTAWMATGKSVFGHYAAINTGIALFNFFPLVKMDGYWMLVHLVGEPNLKHKGLAALDGLIRTLFARQARQDWRARPELLAFGVAHALALPLFWGMGLFAVFRLGAWISPGLGLAFLGLVGALVLYRAARSSLRYVNSLRIG
jgi:putative peptide zinc metalloprotease protein